MVLNETISLINSEAIELIGPIGGIVTKLTELIQVLVGGIVGLYMILIILRWYEARKLSRILKDIRDDVRKLNRHFGIKEPKEKLKEPFLKRIFKRKTRK